MGSETEQSEEELAASARHVRVALDNLFEHEFQFLSQEDQQERFVMLVSQYSPQVMSRAVLLTHDDSARLPLHLACDKNAPLHVIRWLLESDTQKLSLLKPDKWGDLPLHTTCSRQNVDVVKLLLESDASKSTVFIKDNQGSLPLHMACRYNAPSQVIELLLQSDESHDTLFQEGIYQQLPLHVACRCQAPPEVIKLLLDNDETKKSVLKQDSVGRLPIHLVLLRNPNMDVVKLLLGGMLYHRLLSKGLDKWKVQVHSILVALKTHERDFMTRDKLDVIAKALKDFRERVFLLELALWRASCLGFNNSNTSTHSFHSMQDIVSLEETNSTFDADEYKRHAHVMSGAEIIVPHVLAFLEDEPIAQILGEIQ